MVALLEAFTGDFAQVSGDPERNSVVMAMLMLLGSRQADVYSVDGFPRLERSILNFGVDDLHRLRNARQVDRYCEDLARRIQNFDQRLEAVVVRAEDYEEGNDENTLRLMITVRMLGQVDSIGLATDIRLTDGNCNIRVTGGD